MSGNYIYKYMCHNIMSLRSNIGKFTTITKRIIYFSHFEDSGILQCLILQKQMNGEVPDYNIINKKYIIYIIRKLQQ